MKKYFRLLGALGISLALGSFNALAQDEESEDDGGDDTSFSAEGGSSGLGSGDRRFYFSPMASYTYVEDDRNTDDGLGGTMSLGKRLTSGLNLELTAVYNTLGSKAAADATVELTGVGIGAQLFVVQSLPGLYGLLALHQGQGRNHPTTPAVINGTTRFDYRTTLFDSGVGYLFPLTEMVGMEMYLRAEARYRMDAHNKRLLGINGDKHFYDGVFNLGVQIPLGDLPAPPAPPVEEVAVVAPEPPADRDGDGVPDEADACPDTPGDDGKGCVAVVDSDGDGVPDDKDRCPDTPAGTAVDEGGCPVVTDADGDGVADDGDSCPDTAAGSTVNASGCVEAACRAPAPGEPITLDGCATGDAIVLRGVTFEFNSSRLTANAKVILNGVADALNARPEIKAEVGGHTDNLGSDAYNQKLSERRAQSVHDYLVARGVAPERMASRGYGETQPVDTNESEEGREINRRVEMKIIESEAAAP